MKCEHESCGNREKVWMPYISREAEHGLKQLPYCIHCGVPKDFRISDAQIRLIINELSREEGFEDPCLTTGFAQEKMFQVALKKYCNVQEAAVKSLL